MVARMVGECRDKYNGCPEQCRENVTLKKWKRNDDWSDVGQDILNRITIHRQNANWRGELMMQLMDVAINVFMVQYEMSIIESYFLRPKADEKLHHDT